MGTQLCRCAAAMRAVGLVRGQRAHHDVLAVEGLGVEPEGRREQADDHQPGAPRRDPIVLQVDQRQQAQHDQQLRSIEWHRQALPIRLCSPLQNCCRRHASVNAVSLTCREPAKMATITR